MRKLLLAAVAVLALAGPASARDWWNGSGFSLDHQYHSPFDNIFGPRYRGPIYTPRYDPPVREDQREFHVYMGDRDEVEVVHLQSEDTLRALQARAVAKARLDERICNPVKLYTDDGIIYHRALGCTR